MPFIGILIKTAVGEGEQDAFHSSPPWQETKAGEEVAADLRWYTPLRVTAEAWAPGHGSYSELQVVGRVAAASSAAKRQSCWQRAQLAAEAAAEASETASRCPVEEQVRF